MRKGLKNVSLILMGVLFSFSLIGCSNTAKKVSVEINDFNKIKSELSLFPKEYKADIAVKDGCFVIVHGELKSKISVMDTFVSNSKSGKASSITIVQYTDEGDALITKVVYSNHKYYGIDDGTRDAFASLENRIYTEFEYKYLKVFQEKNNTTFYLVNDDKLSSNDIWKSKISCDSKDFINYKFLCSYNNQ